ncbi:sulfotransferase domain-containing protein [Paraglaciecola arctica]|uniref:sulfotransferase domain-containing protein n=1 Tax=Paraglaciecola arctica TaxID=1128911 RepID=UPI001C066FD6|nr:sulfotransferase domain-containing protein [Paraglaciecola arctica]MBU3002091.1 sulfotransferase domain-containing protein [Paraglaciecola arctica]
MNKVKFLVVGAAKSGTTSLYNYINQHPSVFMPENKEPRFFCDYDIEKFNFGKTYFHSDITSTKEQYLSLFKDAPVNSMCGEASTDYLACENTAQRIVDWDKNIKIIIMLRNPIERAYSEYLHAFRAKFQKETFWESLMLEEKRKNEFYDPIFFHVTRGLYYKPVSEFINKLDTKIIFFEDFKNNSQKVTYDVLDFLRLEQVELDTSEKFNSGTQNYYQQIPLSYVQHHWLLEQFHKDICKLQDLLNINLEHWLRPLHVN